MNNSVDNRDRKRKQTTLGRPLGVKENKEEEETMYLLLLPSGADWWTVCCTNSVKFLRFERESYILTKRVPGK